jgi:release factor glutamine methyltransferase
VTRPSLADQRDVDDVYGPAEDSRLLAESAESFVDAGDRVLDVGTGSGHVGLHLRETAGARVVGSDRSPRACHRARENGLAVVRTDLVAGFRDGAFDVVVFNPPYLPTPPEQEWDDWMERALSGGADGRRVVDPFVETVGRVLAPGGTVLLLVSTLTDPDAVRDHAAANGFETDVVGEESYPFETLLVLELRRGDA